MTLSIEKRTHKPPRILIYGPPKVGKSTFGSLAPSPIFIQTEDGLDAIDAPAFPLCQSFAQVLQYLGELAPEAHDYQTLVVDSADWLERLIHAQVAKEKNVKSLEDIGYGKGYLFALDLWRQYIECINYLRDEKSMMIIQIAHGHIKRFENPETDSYDRYQIKMHDKASAMLMEHSDIILFANHLVGVKKEQEGFSKRARAIGSGDRALFSEERPAFVAGNRFGLPQEIPFDKDGSYWATIASHVPYFNQTKGE
jgi:hypothetical protein